MITFRTVGVEDTLDNRRRMRGDRVDKIRWRCGFFFLFIMLIGLGGHTAVAQDNEAIVQVVLFYSPTCPHCHAVIDETLPPLHEQYGDQLYILGFDISRGAGQNLYQNTITAFQIPQERIGVPTLVIGDVVLVGSQEIPEQFPDLVEAGLAAGGVGAPDIPGLMLIMPDLILSANSVQVEGQDIVESVSPPPDPVGVTLGWLVLLGLGLGFWRLRGAWPVTNSTSQDGRGQSVIVLSLILIGLGVAIYLSYVEMMQVTAVCGPVGECNIVQSSPYAQILGIPVAILGVLNYLALGFIWLLRRPLQRHFFGLPMIILVILTLVGVLFSIYLTLLELLVIHTICAWCLTSAVVTILLYVQFTSMILKRPSFLKANVQAGD